MRIWSAGILALAAGISEAAAQQVLEVDMDAGREVVGGLEYLFGFEAVVDYGRRQVLVTEAADPLAVTAYSLDDGSVQSVFGGGPAGDGPGELKHVDAVALGPDGVLVAGIGRVLYWSWSGALPISGGQPRRARTMSAHSTAVRPSRCSRASCSVATTVKALRWAGKLHRNSTLPWHPRPMSGGPAGQPIWHVLIRLHTGWTVIATSSRNTSGERSRGRLRFPRT